MLQEFGTQVVFTGMLRIPFNHILQLLSGWWSRAPLKGVLGHLMLLAFSILGVPPARLIQHFMGSVLGMLQTATNPLKIPQQPLNADEHAEKWEGLSEMKL